jgi:hypothetical protein
MTCTWLILLTYKKKYISPRKIHSEASKVVDDEGATFEVVNVGHMSFAPVIVWVSHMFFATPYMLLID